MTHRPSPQSPSAGTRTPVAPRILIRLRESLKHSVLEWHRTPQSDSPGLLPRGSRFNIRHAAHLQTRGSSPPTHKLEGWSHEGHVQIRGSRSDHKRRGRGSGLDCRPTAKVHSVEVGKARLRCCMTAPEQDAWPTLHSASRSTRTTWKISRTHQFNHLHSQPITEMPVMDSKRP